MKRSVLHFASYQLILFAVSLTVWLYAPKSDHFEKHYYQGVFLNQEWLTKTRGLNRIVLLGGSSLGMGVSAEQISTKTGTVTFNLGVGAHFGYPKIWQMYKNLLVPGKDVIVLSPEYKLVTTHDIHSDGYCDLIFLSQSAYGAIKNPTCVPRIFFVAYKDLYYWITNSNIGKSVYHSGAFNAYGDSALHYDLSHRELSYQNKGTWQVLTIEDIERYQKFVRENISSKGFEVLYDPTVIPATHCDDADDVLVDFQTRLSRLGLSKAIFSIEDLCWNDDMFFDTPYHLLRSGVKRRSDRIVELIKFWQERHQGLDTADEG